jgi:hypothetical protein
MHVLSFFHESVYPHSLIPVFLSMLMQSTTAKKPAAKKQKLDQAGNSAVVDLAGEAGAGAL